MQTVTRAGARRDNERIRRRRVFFQQKKERGQRFESILPVDEN